MSRKLLVDTNIILDAAISERPEHLAALLLMDEFAYSEAKGYITSVSLKDIYYVLSKYRDEKSAREFVVAVLESFEVLSVDSSICRSAAYSDEPDFEDGIVRACAESVPVDLIISRDSAAFKRSMIKSMTAQEYIDAFCDVEEVNLS